MENKKQQPLRIMVDFCATMLHHGHIRLIQKAKSHFKTETQIVIGLATDDEIVLYKGYQPEISFAHRKEILEALRDVDEVVATPWKITEATLKTYHIDYLVHGDDNQNDVEQLLVFPRTESISSNQLRIKTVQSIVQKRNSEKLMFTPGPSNMSYLNMFDLKSAFGRGDDEYTQIENLVLKNILKLTDHDQIVRLQGGGTTAIDVATSNIVLGKILIIDAGYYSKRIGHIIEQKLDSLPQTTYKIISYNDIENELLVADTYDWIATAYVETAEAFLSDIHLLKKLAERKQAKLFLDATASINLESNHHLADVCTFSSCKGLGGLTGAAFITYKDAAYQPEKRGNIPFTLDLETHKNKLYTGPYHAICSLHNISKNFSSITANVKQSKAFFLEKYNNRLIRPLSQQPLISTVIEAKSVAANQNVVLYQPRTSAKNTAVICHLGDMFTDSKNCGKIYDALLIN